MVLNLSMEISPKEKKSITAFLDKFKINTFEENDIKLFLIEVREYLNEETFLRELADFIAHGTRNQGMCFTAVLSRHMRMSSYKKRVNELMTKEFMEANKDKPESFFSRKFLDYIDFRKISNKDFKIYIIDALEDLDEEFLEEQTKFKKEYVRHLISVSYTKVNGFHVLKPNLTKEAVFIMDELLLFIRGAITTKSVFTQEEILTDFVKISSKFDNDEFSKPQYKQSKDDLIVCIMAMLHDRRFKLNNGETANCYLHVENGNVNFETIPNEQKKWTLNVNVSADNFGFPIITSDIKPKNYITNFNELYGSGLTMESVTEVYTKRNSNGKLELINNL